MPEGDTIATFAAALRPWLVAERLTGAECRWPRVVEGLQGATVVEIRTVGKHMLIGFDEGSWLRIHLKMTGSWHRYDPGERWQRPRGDLAVALHTERHVVVCFKAPDVERIDGRLLDRHPVLSALGPDLMDDDADLAEVLRRCRRGEHRRLADLLLDQRVACGLGNVYKSELAFFVRVSPFVAPTQLTDEQLTRIYALGGRWLRENVGRARTTTGRARPRLFVYSRARQPCLRCRTPIRSYREDAADRVTYWCPSCQAGPTEGAGL